jgi:hypothetical protein
MRINALLDAGFRRHDEIMAATAIFNKPLVLGSGFKVQGSRFKDLSVRTSARNSKPWTWNFELGTRNSNCSATAIA